MLDASPLQIAAYGSMGLLTAWSVYRVAGALDAVAMLARQHGPARRLRTALADPRARVGAVLPRRARKALQRLEGRSAPTARLLDAVVGSDPAARDAAQARFAAEIETAVSRHLHRLARPAAVAGPLGLGFTVLALMVHLLGAQAVNAESMAAATAAAPGGVGAGLLEALPVSLGTTAIACFNLVLLKPTASLIAQLAESTTAVGIAASEAWSEWACAVAEREPER